MSHDPSTALESLSTSFTVLEAALAPFLATPLEETLAQNDGEPLQKAKLQVMVGYVVHALIWSEFTVPGPKQWSCSWGVRGRTTGQTHTAGVVGP